MKQKILAIALALGLSSGVSARGLPFEINDVISTNGGASVGSGLTFGPANNFDAVYLETINASLDPATGTGTFNVFIALVLEQALQDSGNVVIFDQGGDSALFKSLQANLYALVELEGDLSFTPAGNPSSLMFDNFQLDTTNFASAFVALDNEGDSIQRTSSTNWQADVADFVDDTVLFASNELNGFGGDSKDGRDGSFTVTFTDLQYAPDGSQFFGIEHEAFRVDGNLPGDDLFNQFSAQAVNTTPDANGFLNFEVTFAGDAAARFIKVNAPAGVALFGLGLIGLARLRRNA